MSKAYDLSQFVDVHYNKYIMTYEYLLASCETGVVLEPTPIKDPDLWFAISLMSFFDSVHRCYKHHSD